MEVVVSEVEGKVAAPGLDGVSVGILVSCCLREEGQLTCSNVKREVGVVSSDKLINRSSANSRRIFSVSKCVRGEGSFQLRSYRRIHGRYTRCIQFARPDGDANIVIGR